MTKKITLEYIKETRPNVYAELCLEVGDKESALEIYEKTNPFRAAELALELNRYQQANTLADKALKFSKEILEDAQRYAKETAEAGMGGGLGAAFTVASAHNNFDVMKRRIADLKSRLEEKI